MMKLSAVLARQGLQVHQAPERRQGLKGDLVHLFHQNLVRECEPKRPMPAQVAKRVPAQVAKRDYKRAGRSGG
jgi:hypothetical protein